MKRLRQKMTSPRAHPQPGRRARPTLVRVHDVTRRWMSGLMSHSPGDPVGRKYLSWSAPGNLPEGAAGIAALRARASARPGSHRRPGCRWPRGRKPARSVERHRNRQRFLARHAQGIADDPQRRAAAFDQARDDCVHERLELIGFAPEVRFLDRERVNRPHPFVGGVGRTSRR